MPARYNARSTTGTRTRVSDVCPFSGLCPICISECPVLCEVSKSAFRGREVLYPEPEYFGKSTAASLKDYYLEWADLQILPEVRGAEGIEADPDKAIFPAVDITTQVAGIPMKIPVTIAALGSTAVAKNNWDGLAVGAAMTGIIQIIGENVCGMDPELKLDSNGKVAHSTDMKYRVEKYREFWDGKHGDIGVQTNVEDQRLGVDIYALTKLEVNIIERKWGQGAKAIGGEVRLNSIERAIQLKKRGYLVIPDPEDKAVQEAFKAKAFDTFERHSRVGMPTKESFLEDIDKLREQGAKKVFLKTGAYRPAVVAFTLKLASLAKIDAVTFDGAGGGTGMSPVPMMDECGTPTVYLEAQVLDCLNILKEGGMHIPDILMAGGFNNETQIFKAIALSNFGNKPYVKAIAMARAPLTAVMKATYFAKLAEEERLPRSFAEKYGKTIERMFITSTELKQKYGERFSKLPAGAIGLYTYLNDRIGIGLKQLMAGCRKFKLDLLDRSLLASLTERAHKVTKIPLLEDVDRDIMVQILTDD